jgi:molybdopterin synthase sulfur carrier subunit
MSEHLVTIILFANLKEKAGTGRIEMKIPLESTVTDLKRFLKESYPSLGPQLANVVVLINKHHIFLDEDVIPEGAEITFLPPIAGG